MAIGGFLSREFLTMRTRTFATGLIVLSMWSAPGATIGTGANAVVVLNLDDDDTPPPTIKEVMAALNKGPEALTPAIGKALNKKEPDWPSIEDQCVTFLRFAKALGENVPPRGDPASWKRQTTLYHENAQALSLAVQRHDREAALAVHARLRRACTACHLKHKP